MTLVRGIRMKGLPGSGIAMVFGLMTALVGLMFLAFPVEGAISLTIILAILFFFQGAMEIGAAMLFRGMSSWGWMLVSGLASLVLAILLLLNLPATAPWAIGLLVGINLLFTGISLLNLGTVSSVRIDEGADDDGV